MFSIIVCSHRPERAARIRVHYDTLFRDYAHEFILIDDARSLSEGYTRGYEASRGELLIFSHDDIEFVTPDVPSRLDRHLIDYDVVGIAGTTKLIDGSWATAGDPCCFTLVIYPLRNGLYSLRYVGAGPLCISGIQALDGCFIACKREVVAQCGFDDDVFDGFHLYDLDFTYRAHRNGFVLAVCRDLALIHESPGDYSESWETYNKRFQTKFSGQLAVSKPGTYQTMSASGSKEQLALFCRPEHLVTVIPWNTYR